MSSHTLNYDDTYSLPGQPSTQYPEFDEHLPVDLPPPTAEPAFPSFNFDTHLSYVNGPTAIPAVTPSGPLLVPAVQSSGDDYFNYSSLAPSNNVNYMELASQPHKRKPSGTRKPPTNKHLLNTRPSAIRHNSLPLQKSGLSQVYVHQVPQLKNQAKPDSPKRKRKPAFHLPLDDLRAATALPQHLPSLHMVDQDLAFGDEAYGLNNDFTPSMKPPGTDPSGYFEPPQPTWDAGDMLGFNFDMPKSRHSSLDESWDLTGVNQLLKPDLAFDYDSTAYTNPSSFDQFSDLYKDLGHPVKNTEYYGLLPPNQPPHRTLQEPSHSVTSSVDTPAESEKKSKRSKGARCPVCDKYISRDLKRHMRIHNDIGRFQCIYPKSMCKHKTGNFNRPYDYKKHLLHLHFDFDDPKGKASHTLTDKLPFTGQCAMCGVRMIAGDWLDKHVLTSIAAERCPYVEDKPDLGLDSA